MSETMIEFNGKSVSKGTPVDIHVDRMRPMSGLLQAVIKMGPPESSNITGYRVLITDAGKNEDYANGIQLAFNGSELQLINGLG